MDDSAMLAGHTPLTRQVTDYDAEIVMCRSESVDQQRLFS